jgi:5-methylcytosine-specific restriction endonuclease McrA
VAEAIKRQPFCTDCGTRGSKANPLTGDHKVPLSKGGTARTLADVVVACRSCNSSRGGGGRSPIVAAGAVTRKPAFGERNERKKIKIAGPKSDSQTEPLIG